MSELRVKVRANMTTGELEVEGSPQAVEIWWNRLWPELSKQLQPIGATITPRRASLPSTPSPGNTPEDFGELFAEFRSDISDVEKMLVAAVFAQSKEVDRNFTTKAANQLLLDQGVKVTNPSECVRRLKDSKRVFVIADGKFRVSATGFESFSSLKSGN